MPVRRHTEPRPIEHAVPVALLAMPALGATGAFLVSALGWWAAALGAAAVVLLVGFVVVGTRGMS